MTGRVLPLGEIIGCAFAAYPSAVRRGCLNSAIDNISLSRYIDANSGSSRAASQQPGGAYQRDSERRSWHVTVM
jgi:hypothetical protein